MKKLISMNYGSRISSWKPWRWVSFDLIPMMRDTYINSNLNLLTKFTSSSRSTEFKDILPWNISKMIANIIPVTTRIFISYAMKWGILFWVYWEVSGNWDNIIIRIPQEVSEERNKFKRGGLWKSQSGIWIRKLTIWLRSFDL